MALLGGRPAAALRPWLTWPAWGVLLLTLALSLLFPAQAAAWQFWPFVAGMFVLGLPHGALDHLAPLFVLHRRFSWGWLAVFVPCYLALAGLYLLLWQLWPAGALAGFLLLSWLHWGQGDAYYLLAFAGRPVPKTRAERLLVWAVRGGLPIVLPVLAHPAILSAFTSGILGWYGHAGGWLLDGWVRLAGLTILAALAASYLWLSWRRGQAGFWEDAGEVALLAVYFWETPPILAVGIYFCVWHAARHLARLAVLDEANAADLTQGTLGPPLRRVSWEALPMTLGALALLGGLYVWHGRAAVSVGSLVYLYLSLIAALTFPHFLLVLWMDREEAVQQNGHAVGGVGRSD